MEGGQHGHASRSSGLFHVKASRDRISLSALKTSGGTTVGRACGIIMQIV
jgi:hypothetical protein